MNLITMVKIIPRFLFLERREINLKIIKNKWKIQLLIFYFRNEIQFIQIIVVIEHNITWTKISF